MEVVYVTLLSNVACTVDIAFSSNANVLAAKSASP